MTIYCELALVNISSLTHEPVMLSVVITPNFGACEKVTMKAAERKFPQRECHVLCISGDGDCSLYKKATVDTITYNSVCACK